MNRRNFLQNSSLGVLGAQTSLGGTTIFGETPTMKKIKANRLKRGDYVGLVTPASPASDEKIQRAVQNIESLGFKVKESEAIRFRHGHLAGTDAQRLAHFHSMFSDKEVKAVWAVRGGYGCTRILPNIDFNLIKKNPKIVIGYSDVTALLTAIYQKTGLICFHGPVGATPFTEYNIAHLTQTLIAPAPTQVIALAPANVAKEDVVFRAKTLVGGSAQGQLVGGNLCLLASMVGTPFQANLADKIVFMEDVGEKPYRIDRMLTQLLQSSNLHKAKAIILGVFEDCQPKNEEFSLSLMDTLEDRLVGLNIPLMYGFSFGHIQNMCTLPLGVEATFNADAQTLTLLETAVK